MAVLLTGATGFVGLNIAAELIGRGHDVVLFAPTLPDALARSDWFSRGRFVMGDIRSGADLARVFATASVTDVVHAAALTPDAQREASEPGEVAGVNLVGTMQVMQAARRASIRRVLSVSSVAVYGQAAPAPGDRYHEAASAPRPATLYGITKLAAEQAIHRLGALYGIDTVIVRLGPCFGIREYRSGARALMSPHWQCVEALLAGSDCVLPRPLAADWIDAAEAARAVADLLHADGLHYQLFNLGGGEVTTAATWCEALSVLRPDFRWRIDPDVATVRYGLERDRAAMDTDRLEQALGWRPRPANLLDRARRYLLWREGPEGQALAGPPPKDPIAKDTQ
ncbi:MAG: NAD(P)-dependent oxidoreductase [Pseudomonadota bacterium]|nr:NAD(P)-dependent oxidoreductase [Pseudomonadota bacterium]